MSKITNGSYTIYYNESRGLVDVDAQGNVSVVAQSPEELGFVARYDLGHISDNPTAYRLATKRDVEEYGCVYLDDTLHRPLMTRNCQTCPDRYVCLLSEVEYPYFREYSEYDYSNYEDISSEEKEELMDAQIQKLKERLASLGLLEELEAMF